MEEIVNIDWHGDDSPVLLNPRAPDELPALPVLKAHVWLRTSGSEGGPKFVALGKAALLASAQAVNEFLGATAKDRWLRVLPTFHVGGLSIYARAFLAESAVVEMPTWDAKIFAEKCTEVSFSSLVPAQIYDLVRARLVAPPNLRNVFVGGGPLDPGLRQSATDLAWPITETYGMTETASQVAVRSGKSADFVCLPHAEFRTGSTGALEIKSAALFSGYFENASGPWRFRDPKVDGWFTTADLGTVEGRALNLRGRAANFIKIGGESVDLGRLEMRLAGLVAEAPEVFDAALVAVPDARLGCVLHLRAVGGQGPAELLASAFNAGVYPFEKIRSIALTTEIPRTSLGKILRAKLRDSPQQPKPSN